MTDDEKPKRERPKHLQLVDTSLDYGTRATPAAAAARQEHDPGPVPELPETFLQEVEAEAQHDAAAVIGNAVMHAAMSWVACCQEKDGVTVSVATLGSGLFDAEVLLADGSSVFLRVTLILESGPRLRTVVEPIHP